ncbi:hypothetical protein BASA81_017933 [Batrachochytrium salamandrivorans]|nr:hypothetical protein BASA81_017933 [Batrachochytrium salamandrivorans]
MSSFQRVASFDSDVDRPNPEAEFTEEELLLGEDLELSALHTTDDTDYDGCPIDIDEFVDQQLLSSASHSPPGVEDAHAGLVPSNGTIQMSNSNSASSTSSTSGDWQQ